MLSRIVRISRFRPQLVFFNSNAPKGFEKFQRKSKKTQEKQPENPKEEQEQVKESEKKQEQVIEQEQEESKQTKQDEPQEEKLEKQKSNRKLKEPKFEKPQSVFKEQYKQDYYNFTKKQQNTQKPNGPPPQFDPNNPMFKQYGMLLMITAPILYLFYRIYEDRETYISFSEFMREYLDKRLVNSIEIQKQEGELIAVAHTINGTKRMKISNLDYFLQVIDDHQTEKKFEQLIPISFINQDDILETTSNIKKYGAFIVYFGLGVLGFTFFKRMRDLTSNTKNMMDQMMGGMTKMDSKQFEQKIKIKFKDVAGQEEAKGEIKEFVDFLKAPSKYKKLGARIPRGALLTGPPGTGKTLLAKACAGEAGVPFFSVSGSEFVEMYVGLGAARVRELFKQAKSKAPSIVFIDEIDAVGKKRNAKGSKNEERENTLNQLLVEMDGFDTDSTVVVLAATNIRDMLDPALTRPGRFDRSIEITLPDINGRKEIFKVHLKPLKLDPSKTADEYANRLATLTPGFSGAEIANLCNEAAILAARKNAEFVTSHHFELATERVVAGLEKKKFMSEEDRKVVAYHESGHGVVSWFLAGGDPLLKLTIIPRSKGSLGYAQYLPNESNLQTKQELLDKICCVLGGRIAEKHFFNSITTGAGDDLRKAYNIAYAIITKFGMNDEIGYLGYQEDQFSKDYSDKTNEIIDREMSIIIDECAKRTEQLILQYEDKITALSQLLLEKETLDLQQIMDLLGERPFKPRSNYKAYLDLKKVEQAEVLEESKQEEINEKLKQEQNQNQENQEKQENQENQEKQEKQENLENQEKQENLENQKEQDQKEQK